MAKPIKTFVVGPIRATIHEVKHTRGDQEVTTHTIRIQLKNKGENGDGKRGFWVPHRPFIEAAVRKALDFLALREWEQYEKTRRRKSEGARVGILSTR